MDIRTDSFFYKYLNFIYWYVMSPTDIPKNVCNLFWYVVFGTVGAIGKTAAIAFIFVAGIGIAAIGLITIIESITFQSWSFMNDFRPLNYAIAWVITLVFGIVGILEYRESDHYNQRMYKLKQERESGQSSSDGFRTLTKSYFRSFKDKVCPTVRFVEKVDNS